MDFDKVIEAFERHCIGEVNVTDERYVLNRRIIFDLRSLIRSCDYGALVEPILRGRIVIGIQDDATR